MITYVGDQVAIQPLANPAPPTVTRGGLTGSTTYAYKVVAIKATGHTAVSDATTVTTGNATLDALHYFDIRPVAVPGAVSYDVYRVTGGLTQGKIGTVTGRVVGGVQMSFLRDTGRVAVSGAPPESNTTGELVLGSMAEHTLLVAGPGGLLHGLSPGDNDQVLTMVAGAPDWAAAAGGGGEQLFKVHTTTLNDAAIKALPDTPYAILASPGPGKVAVPVMTLFHLNASAGAYGNIPADSGYLAINYDSGTGLLTPFPNNSIPDPPLTWLTDFFASDGIWVTYNGPLVFNTSFGAMPMLFPANVIDAGLQLFVQALGNGPFSGGHADNTLTVTLYYVVLTV